MMSNENINEALKNLSEEERELALSILKQMAADGQSALFDDLKYSDFEEIPVDIDTFLDDDRYLGRGIWAIDEYSGQRRCTLFPYWRETLHKIFPDNLTTAYNTLILSGGIGLGKAQPLDSIILTDSGFKKMKDITLTDKVYGNDGELHNIVGIFPQGKKTICRVTFSDNTSTLCCNEHLWTVYNIKTRTWQTLDTETILKNGLFQSKNSIGHKYKIPITTPINFKAKEVQIPAYTLGCLIGDGSLTQHVSLSCNTVDDEILNNIKLDLANKLPNIYLKKFHTLEYSFCSNTTKNEINRAIKYYNLNVTAKDKHIPIEYLNNSIEMRIALLQGLMDTDGSIDKNGRLVFITCSEQLKNDFVYLIQSLGGICHVQYKQTNYEYKKIKKQGLSAYYISFKLPSTICPFKLTRKKERINSKCLAPFRYITAIEYIGKEDCQCIYIDSKEHLYLTNDFIVTHNTLISSVTMLYLLYRMLCLKDPYNFYGLMPSDKITFSMLNITLETARGVGWDRIQQLLQGSDWFMAHGELNASRTAPTWQPDKRIELIFGSSSNNNSVIGRALFCNFTDEANFSGGNIKNVENQKTKLKKMIAQIDARMVSRFGKGIFLPTLNIIASSKDSDQSFLEDYIKQKSQDSKTLTIDEPQWIIRTDKGSPNDPGAFWVAVGGKLLAHELLPVDATDLMVDTYRKKGYTMIKVPPIYRRDFETNLDQSLMDAAGLSSASSTKFISGSRLVAAKTNTYENLFVKDIIEVGDGPEDHLQYANFFDLSKVSAEDKARPLFIHLDMSTGGKGSGDKTGIAGVWITGKQPSIPGQAESLSLRYKLAFSVSVKSPKGYNISFIKNQNFIKWLREQGFAIKMITADTYQSAPVLQELSAAGFKTSIQSVDRVNTDKIAEPYYYLKSAIYDRRVEIYDKCDLLTDELVNLEREASGKINHPENGKYGSKDQADAFCGALFTASKFAEEYSYQYGDNLAAGLDVSIEETSDEAKKRQIIVDFETELAKINMEIESGQQKRNEEYKRYMDISDGIIVI